LFFEQPQDWSAAESLAFDLLAGATRFNVDLYVGAEDARATYTYSAESLAVTADVWVPYEIRWEQFRRVAWEENAGAAFNQPGQVSGIAFGFNTESGQSLRGQVWIDNLHLAIRSQNQSDPEPAHPSQPEATSPTSPFNLPCAGALAAPLALVGFAARQKIKRQNQCRCNPG